jgi:dipeptidyl aminopeptidase/acylaminoacyl peptidase
VLTGLRFSLDSKRLGFTLTRASEPGEAFGCDLDSGTLTRWTRSRNPGFEPGDFVEPELIRYRSFDEREIPVLFYPARRRPGAGAGGRSPVIVVIHGGPESQSRPSFSARLQYYLRELNAAVIAPNVRGSTGYGKTYALLDNGLKREDSVRDIGALLDWIRKDPRLDAGRVALVGGSYGGFMVLASLVRFPDRIRAGVDSVGVSNFITFLENTSPYRQELRRAEYGDERDPEMRRFFERISPAHRMDGIRSALLVIHGANDPRVPMTETENIVERARASGQPVWTLYAANEGHGFTRLENTAYEAAVVSVFLRRYL